MSTPLPAKISQLAESSRTRVPITDLDVKRAATLNAPPGVPNAQLATQRSGGVNHIYGILGVINQIFAQLTGPTHGIMDWQLGMTGLTTAAQFPQPVDVFIGWTAKVMAAVIDNDPTRTNTGQSFVAGDLIVWGGSGWVLAASSAVPPPPTAAVNTTYTFPAALPTGTAFNVATGAYPGGPAVLDGPPLMLDASGAAFVADGNILVFVNGLLQNKGSGLGIQDAQWVSSTQLAFAFELFPDDVVTIRTEL